MVVILNHLYWWVAGMLADTVDLSYAKAQRLLIVLNLNT